MSVKDIVQQLESSLGSARPGEALRGGRHSAFPANSPNSTPRTELPTSPARFLHHPLLKRQSFPVPRMKDSPSPADPPRRTKVALESFQPDGPSGIHSPRNEPEERIKRTLQDGMRELRPANRVPLQDAPGPERHIADESRAERKDVDEMNRFSALDTSERMRSSPSHPHDMMSRIIASTPVNDTVVKNSQQVIRSVVKAHTSSPDLSDTSISARPHNAVDGSEGTPTTPRTWGQPTPLSDRGTGIIRMDTKAHVQTDASSGPPAYSSYHTGSLAGASHSSSRTRPSQPLNDIPLDTFSRITHDHYDITTSRPPSPSGTFVSQSPTISHVPVAAKTVFSRHSALLSLPALDQYLSSLPPPTFSSFPSDSSSSNGKQSERTLFPPMELLTASGRTIEELEKNSVVLPVWRNRGTIFNTLAYMAVGAMVNKKATMWMSFDDRFLELRALV